MRIVYITPDEIIYEEVQKVCFKYDYEWPTKRKLVHKYPSDKALIIYTDQKMIYKTADPNRNDNEMETIFIDDLSILDKYLSTGILIKSFKIYL